jgi:hypothetical protein
MIRELKDPRGVQDLVTFKRRYERLRQEYLMGKVGLILKSNAPPLRQLQDRIRELYLQTCRYADATISFLEQTKVKPRGGLQIGQRPNR